MQNGKVHCWDSHWWKDLRRLYQHNDFKIIHQNMAWKAGCGDKIRFWKDRWLGEESTLQQKYSQLFSISKQQNDFISTMGSFSQNIWRWDLKWRRHLFEHEEGVAVAFMEDITAYTLQNHLKDKLLWKADPSGLYSTRSAYRLLSSQNSTALDGINFQLVWKLKIPPKAAIFTWRLIKDRLPTRANLHRRNVEVQDLTCPLCHSEQEEAGHLFFHCRYTVGLWWESLRWIQTFGALPSSPTSHFSLWCEGLVAGRNQNRWCGWWIALTSAIWKHRNLLIFQGIPFINSKVMDDALFLAWSWSKARVKGFNIPFNHWSSHLMEAFD